MKRFPKKRVLITGAGSGLGRALSLEFAKMGWRVFITDIDLNRAEETLEMVKAGGGKGFTKVCDVTKISDIESAAETVKKEWGGVDIVINNAGVAAGGFMERIPLEDWEWILNINFKSVLYGCRVFIPVLEKQGCGHIVNVASSAGLISLPEMSSYNVTKAAVVSLSETLRFELSKKNIGVTVVTPTFFKTNLMDQFRSTDKRQKNMANAFFAKSSVTSEKIARHVYRSVRKKRMYVITQWDGKMLWRFKRFFPRTFIRVISYGYRKGHMEKFLGI